MINFKNNCQSVLFQCSIDINYTGASQQPGNQKTWNTMFVGINFISNQSEDQ